MNVYVLIHRGVYDESDEIRGVYADRDTASSDITTQTSTGEPSQAWWAHNEACCGVEEWEVLTTSSADIQENPVPFDPSEGMLVPESLMDFVDAWFRPVNIYREGTKR